MRLQSLQAAEQNLEVIKLLEGANDIPKGNGFRVNSLGRHQALHRPLPLPRGGQLFLWAAAARVHQQVGPALDRLSAEGSVLPGQFKRHLTPPPVPPKKIVKRKWKKRGEVGASRYHTTSHYEADAKSSSVRSQEANISGRVFYDRRLFLVS